MLMEETLAAAVERHSAGQLWDAERLYRRILKVQPNNTNALHLLGLVVWRGSADRSDRIDSQGDRDRSIQRRTIG